MSNNLDTALDQIEFLFDAILNWRGETQVQRLNDLSRKLRVEEISESVPLHDLYALWGIVNALRLGLDTARKKEASTIEVNYDPDVKDVSPYVETDINIAADSSTAFFNQLDEVYAQMKRLHVNLHTSTVNPTYMSIGPKSSAKYTIRINRTK